MPFIRISVLGPILTPDQIGRIQQGTTDLMVSVMGKPLDGVAVLVEQVAPGAWSIAGRLTAVAAHVEAIVAADTSSPDDRAQFIAEMLALLRSVLGPTLPEATYIAVRETDPTAYGRGGLTRADRDRRRRGGG
jgi:4-oxalocrotonate tautomerase